MAIPPPLFVLVDPTSSGRAIFPTSYSLKRIPAIFRSTVAYGATIQSLTGYSLESLGLAQEVRTPRSRQKLSARLPPPGLVMDSRRADSMVDVVWIEPRSIPSSAMVCAIAGEMPEMMVLHPINTAALAILIR